MRRITTITIALVALGAATAAYASLNSYTTKLAFSPGQAGSPGKPAPVKVTVDQTMSAATAGSRAAPTRDIKVSVYGLVADSKDYPTCSLSSIASAKSDASCNPRALVASGYITAVVGPSDLSQPGSSCDPLLHVWNGGGNKLVFFMVMKAPSHTCFGGAITTGVIRPFPATVSYSRKFYVIDVPIPNYVAFPAGLVTSLLTNHLVFSPNTATVHGKPVAMMSSVACQNGTRPYTAAFTDQPSQGGAPETITVDGAAACSK